MCGISCWGLGYITFMHSQLLPIQFYGTKTLSLSPPTFPLHLMLSSYYPLIPFVVVSRSNTTHIRSSYFLHQMSFPFSPHPQTIALLLVLFNQPYSLLCSLYHSLTTSVLLHTFVILTWSICVTPHILFTHYLHCNQSPLWCSHILSFFSIVLSAPLFPHIAFSWHSFQVI